MPKAISTQIRRDNQNNITYVLKKYADQTYELNVFQSSNNCYRLVKQKKGGCSVINPFLEAL
jgi:hypothetical protein